MSKIARLPKVKPPSPAQPMSSSLDIHDLLTALPFIQRERKCCQHRPLQSLMLEAVEIIKAGQNPLNQATRDLSSPITASALLGAGGNGR